MIAYLLTLALLSSQPTQPVESAIKLYVESNFPDGNGEYDFDFRRINWSILPDECDSVRVFRIGKDSPLGNTIFTLGVYAGDSLVKAVPVSVGVTLVVDALVATTPISVGGKLENLALAKRALTGKGELPFSDTTALIDKQAKKYIRAGDMITPSMCERIPVVNPGDRVNIVMEKGLIKITAEGVARQKGGIGDLIRVVNLSSNQMIRGEIIDSTTVAIR